MESNKPTNGEELLVNSQTLAPNNENDLASDTDSVAENCSVAKDVTRPRLRTKSEKERIGCLITIVALPLGVFVGKFVSETCGGIILLLACFSLIPTLINLIGRGETEEEQLIRQTNLREDLDSLIKGETSYPDIEKGRRLLVEAEKSRDPAEISKRHLSLAQSCDFYFHHKGKALLLHKKDLASIVVGDISLLATARKEFNWVIENSPVEKHRAKAEKRVKKILTEVDKMRANTSKIVNGESDEVEGLNAVEYLKRINTAFPETEALN